MRNIELYLAWSLSYSDKGHVGIGTDWEDQAKAESNLVLGKMGSGAEWVGRILLDFAMSAYHLC